MTAKWGYKTGRKVKCFFLTKEERKEMDKNCKPNIKGQYGKKSKRKSMGMVQ